MCGETMKYCGNCGKENVENAFCCQKCGYIFPDMKRNQVGAFPDVQPSRPQSGNPPTAPGKTKRHQFSKKEKIACIVLSVLIVVIVALDFVLYKSLGDDLFGLSKTEACEIIYDYLSDNELVNETAGGYTEVYLPGQKKSGEDSISFWRYQLPADYTNVTYQDIQADGYVSFQVSGSRFKGYSLLMFENDSSNAVELNVTIDKNKKVTGISNENQHISLKPFTDEKTVNRIHRYDKYQSDISTIQEIYGNMYFYNHSVDELVENIFLNPEVEIIPYDEDFSLYQIVISGKYCPYVFDASWYTEQGELTIDINVDNPDESVATGSNAVLESFEYYVFRSYSY